MGVRDHPARGVTRGKRRGVLVGQKKAARSRFAMSLFPLPTSPNARNEAIANAVGIFVVAGKAFAQDSLLNENPQRQRAENRPKRPTQLIRRKSVGRPCVYYL
jgi:hypothetical protein